MSTDVSIKREAVSWKISQKVRWLWNQMVGRGWECSEELIRETRTLRMLLGKGQRKWGTSYWKLEEGDPCYTVKETLVTMSSAGIWKGMCLINSVIWLKRYLSKGLKVLAGFFLLLMETVADFIFLGSGYRSHEIKKCLFLGRKAMTNLDSVSKSRDITLPTKSVWSKLWLFQ